MSEETRPSDSQGPSGSASVDHNGLPNIESSDGPPPPYPSTSKANNVTAAGPAPAATASSSTPPRPRAQWHAPAPVPVPAPSNETRPALSVHDRLTDVLHRNGQGASRPQPPPAPPPKPTPPQLPPRNPPQQSPSTPSSAPQLPPRNPQQQSPSPSSSAPQLPPLSFEPPLPPRNTPAQTPQLDGPPDLPPRKRPESSPLPPGAAPPITGQSPSSTEQHSQPLRQAPAPALAAAAPVRQGAATRRGLLPSPAARAAFDKQTAAGTVGQPDAKNDRPLDKPADHEHQPVVAKDMAEAHSEPERSNERREANRDLPALPPRPPASTPPPPPPKPTEHRTTPASTPGGREHPSTPSSSAAGGDERPSTLNIPSSRPPQHPSSPLSRFSRGDDSATSGSELPPSPLHDSDSQPHRPRPRRATFSEKKRQIHATAVQHAQEHADDGEKPPIMTKTKIGLSPLQIAGVIIIALLSIQLLGIKRFSRYAAWALGPVLALWLIPLPNFKKAPEEPPPRPADSVGWINNTLEVLFPLISTDVLTPFIDLLEDALIQQVPPIVTSVRCTDVSLGRQPLCLTSLRTISDETWFASIAAGDSNGNGNGNGGSHGNGNGDGSDRSNGNGASHGQNDTDASDPSRPRPVSTSSLKSKGPSAWSDKHDSPGAASDSAKRRSSMASSSRHKRSISSPSAKTGRRESIFRRDSTARRESLAGPAPPTPKLASHDQQARMRKRDRLVQRVRHGRHMLHRHEVEQVGHVPDELCDEAPEVIGDEGEEGEGFYVNYEVSFRYDRQTDKQARGTGLHMLAHFGWGVRGLGGSEIPVYIDVNKLSGTLRLRLLLSPSPPFVRDASFTFVKMPFFDISARPLRSMGFGSINAMDIPLIKTYVQKSIAQVAGGFVSPRHYHLDVDRLLLGKDAAVRTRSIGVLYIVIHGCNDLPRTDTVGSCDPYVAISYSKFVKPVFSTRTIVGTLDPIFEEPAYVLVSDENVETGEKLRLRVCDSDRFSADDTIGKVELDLAEIVEQSANAPCGMQLFRRRDDLQPWQPGMRAQGELEWSVRFFPMYNLPEEEIQRRIEESKDHRGEGHTEPPWWLEWLYEWMEKPQWEIERQQRRREMVDYFTGARQRDEIEATAPPTAEYPSGIIQFHVHQCAELEMDSVTGSFSGSQLSRRKSAASGKPALSDAVDRSPFDNPDPPSAYCEVHLNDKFVFRTRTKQVNTQPYFNAVSERFIRDWRQARITFVIKDERDREHDAILGVVALRLKDVFRDRSQITRWYPLLGGLGWGRLRVSLLFKAINIKLPRGVSSFEACTFDLTSLVTTDLAEHVDRQPLIVVESEYDRATIEPPGGAHGHSLEVRRSASSHDGAKRSGDLSKSRSWGSLRSSGHSTPAPPEPPTTANIDNTWELQLPIRLAVQYRHSCNILFSVATKRRIKKKRVHAIATLRLDDVPDREESIRTIPLFATSSVRDAVVAAEHYRSNPQRDDGSWTAPPNAPDIRLVGFFKVGFVLHPGVSRVHRKLCRRDLKFKAVYDAWEATRLLEGSAPLPQAHETTDEEDTYDHETEESDMEGSDDDDVSPRDRAHAAATALRNDDTQAMLDHSRSHSKALHKDNRGIFQLKLARTGKFVKDKVQAHVLSTTGNRDLAARPHGADIEVEQEGQSSL